MAELSREVVLEVLGAVIEPDLKQDIVSANLIEELQIEGNRVKIKVLVKNPALHARRRMQEAISFNLKTKINSDIEVEAEVAGMPTEARAAHRSILPEVKHVVAIASGKGGVGKSTITANLAGGLAKAGYRVGVVDVDIHGPSMPTMFDVVGAKPTMIEVDGKPMINPVLSYGIKLLSIGFFTD
jgi:ATP-binding protein involved in chromosome partitioning